MASSLPHLMFFAVLPGPTERLATIEATNGVRERAGIRPPVCAPDLLHMTVVPACYVESLDQALLQRLITAGDRVRARSFDIEWDRAAMFGNLTEERALKLLARSGLREARTLQRVAYRTLEQAGVPPLLDDMPTPHVSLFYGRHRFVETITPVTWRVRSFALIESLTERTELVIHKTWALLPSEPLQAQRALDFSAF